MAKNGVVRHLTRNRPAQLSRLGFMEIGDEDRRLLRELADVIAPYLGAPRNAPLPYMEMEEPESVSQRSPYAS